MVAVGSLYIKSKEAAAKDILKVSDQFETSTSMSLDALHWGPEAARRVNRSR